jgi:hypothetical protein
MALEMSTAAVSAARFVAKQNLAHSLPAWAKKLHLPSVLECWVTRKSIFNQAK